MCTITITIGLPSQTKVQCNARSMSKDPSLPHVATSDADSQAEGNHKPAYSQMNRDGEFLPSHQVIFQFM